MIRDQIAEVQEEENLRREKKRNKVSKCKYESRQYTKKK